MIGWAVEAIVASAVLMAAVLLLRAPVRRLFGPAVAYGLWALPVARLAMPPLPADWNAAAPITRMTELVVTAAPLPGGPTLLSAPVEVMPGASWSGALVLAWLAGAGCFLLWHVARYALFRSRVLRAHERVARFGRVRVVRSDAASGPLAFGVLRPHVALPADIDLLYDADERALALAHELGHHARGDLLANWIALVVLAVHWWNPLAWIALHAFRADQELANDAGILRGRGPDAAHAYARAILKAAGGRGHAVACHLHPVSNLKGRIRMLKAAPVSPRRLLTGAAGVALLAASALALTASGTRATAAVTAQLQDTIGVDFAEAELELASLAIPTPPVPPAPLSVPATVPSVPPIAAIPPVPPMPQLPEAAPVPPLPPVPPIPPAPGVGGDNQVTVIRSRDGQAVRRVIRTRDGRDLDLSTLPEISNRRCGPGDRPLVRQERRDGRQLTVICTDRIERVAERAASRPSTRGRSNATRCAARWRACGAHVPRSTPTPS